MTISFIRTILLYIVIIVAVRLMGKRQISELQTSELVVTLLISDIAAIPMQDTGQPLVSGFLPIAVLVCCEILVSAFMLKNMKFRRMICGKPIVVINDGRIDQAQMKRLRMSTEDLSEQLRRMNIFSLSEVAYAIVETNGKMSVMKKPAEQSATASMLGIVVPDNGIECVVISDGQISNFSLSLCRLSEDWIKGVLKGEGVEQSDVFIMTADCKRNYRIIRKQDRQEMKKSEARQG